MKRLALFLSLCLILCGCTPPAQPTETTVPAQAPLPITEPKPQTDSYTIKITDPDMPIHEGPAFRYPCTALVGEAGVYTIVEEDTDSDGNHWGKLKSGIGWICLTEPPICPISAQYAPEHFVASDAWHCAETEYVTDIGIIANETITDVVVSRLGWEESYFEEEILYTQETMFADAPLLISVVFYGDMTTYGIRFTDASGNERCYTLYISGKDGSLICSEYVP